MSEQLLNAGRPFTPKSLAVRWGCSDKHIRNMIERQELEAFRIGRNVRIPAHAVERIEGCGLSNTGATGAQPGQNKDAPAEQASASKRPKVVKMPSVRS